MSKYPALKTATRSTTIAVLTEGKEKSNTKFPVLSRAQIMPHKSDISGNVKIWGQNQIIPNMFMGANNNIPVMRYDTHYVWGDNGKLTDKVDCHVKVGMVDGCIIHEFEYMGEQVNITTNVTEKSNTTRTRTVTKTLGENVIELCELTYGDARKLFLHKSYNGINVDDIIKYDGRNRKEGDKTIYEGALICDAEQEDMAKKLIKDIISTVKKHTICWS